MWTRLWNDVRTSRRFTALTPREAVTQAELAALPPAAQAWMRFNGVSPGEIKHGSFTLGWTGRFRLGPARPWMDIHAVQFNAREPVARFFHMRARMGHVLPMLARDTYVDGHGRMRAKLMGLVTVAEGQGPEFDTGELVTWLNDAVLFAPTMLLDPKTQWTHVDDTAFDVAFGDHGRTVTARVSIDARGAAVDFQTTDRYVNDPDDPKHPLIRAQWNTPTPTWTLVQGHPVPDHGSAIWHLPAGNFTYAEFNLVPASVRYDLVEISDHGGWGIRPPRATGASA